MRATERRDGAPSPDPTPDPVLAPGALAQTVPADAQSDRLGTQVLARYLFASPDLLAVALAGFSVPAMVLLLLGHFSAGLVIPAGALGAAGSVALVRAPSGAVTGRDVRLTLVALALVIVWVVVNARFSAENVFATRDPATYNLTARWLMDHQSLSIPTHSQIFGPPKNSDATSAGFGSAAQGGILYAQGNHLLPALMTVGGWLFGLAGMLKANVVLGGVALFVFFGFARRIVGPVFGLIAMAAMGVSIPMLFVSRDSYTEVLALLLLMGSLSLLHRALLTRRWIDFAAAGLVAGVSGAVRIDSTASMLSLIVAAIVIAAVAPPDRRRTTVGQLALLIGAGAVPMFIGWLDVTRLSYGYYRDQRPHILLLFAAAFALVVIAVPVVALAWSRSAQAFIRSADRRAQLATVMSLVVLLTAVVLWSRPLWMTTTSVRNLSLEDVQRQQGVPVDGSRLYNEYTLEWLAVYYGWPALVLGLGGYVTLINRTLRRPQLTLVPPVCMGLSMSGLYLWNSQITPDQPWAIRRFVPVVLPLMIVAACALLQLLARRWRRIRPAVLAAGALLLIGIPLAISLPVRSLREEAPQLRQVQAICDALGDDAAVLMIDETARVSYSQTLRSYCGVPTNSVKDVSTSTLSEVNANVTASGRRLYVMATDPTAFPGIDSSALKPLSSVEMTRWPSLINKVPTSPARSEVSVYLTTVDEQGHPVALS
ncbi:dolichyl-phosphate-mannose-protein mannosyltransferase [Jatrophihabitans sp. GAS493]|uniref:glycosyltransferase family 39 protein n=1 Tax=Jatrophihabitans sp. GAS493 TaxID=1907575 RepID=UPI000BB99251|nr:glycosyltransferase family 39 protein [Jatrophihabitans sp. GAS493]SOD72994.1 dolichyl-phosphate-mannose-protein mannosyltransferase [Jatrophihabitans sp. GAS493]